jgi:hypothetical protein
MTDARWLTVTPSALLACVLGSHSAARSTRARSHHARCGWPAHRGKYGDEYGFWRTAALARTSVLAASDGDAAPDTAQTMAQRRRTATAVWAESSSCEHGSRQPRSRVARYVEAPTPTNMSRLRRDLAFNA